MAFDPSAATNPLALAAALPQIPGIDDDSREGIGIGISIGTELIDVNQSITGQLERTDNKDLNRHNRFIDDYLLTGTVPGQEIRIHLGSNFDTYLQLVNASTGEVIDKNDDIAGSSNRNSQLEFTVEAGTDYLLRASSYYRDTTGIYTIKTSVQHDITPIGVNHIHIGNLESTDTNNPTRTDRYSDDYWLDGLVAGQEIEIEIEADFDTYLQLIDAESGQVIKYNDDINLSAGNLNSRLNFTAEEETEYLVRATSYRSHTTGEYTLTTNSNYSVIAPGVSTAYDKNEINIADEQDFKSLRVLVNGDTVRVEAETYGNWSPGFSHLYFIGGDNGQVDIIPNSTNFDINGEAPQRRGLFNQDLGGGIPTIQGSQYAFEFSWSNVFGNATEVETWLFSQSSRDSVGSIREPLTVTRSTTSDFMSTEIGTPSKDLAGDSFSLARGVAVATNGRTYQDWVGDNDTVDYYAFSLGTKNDFDLNLTGLSANVSVQLLDSEGTVIDNRVSRGSRQINIGRSLNAGAYRVRVSTASERGTSYNLDLDVTPIIPGVTGVTTTGSDELSYLQTNQSLQLINVDDFRSGSIFRGSRPEFSRIDGSGYSAVVIDTGIDLDHASFGSNHLGVTGNQIVYHQDFAEHDNNANDIDGHGTHVAGIIDAVAPGANLISLKVFKDNKESSKSAYIEQALQWVLANIDRYNIATVNMSLGFGNYNRHIEGTYGDELKALADRNIILVGASGNSFFENNSVPGVAYPATNSHVISVGAVFDNNSNSSSWPIGAQATATPVDGIAPFSQRHLTQTDIFAPGVDVISAAVGNGSTSRSGTSYAAPHIAGMALLAQQLAKQQLDRSLSNTEFLTFLQATGQPIMDGDDENDNVVNTQALYRRADMLGLANRIMAQRPISNRNIDLIGNFFNVKQNEVPLTWGNSPDTVDLSFQVKNLGTDRTQNSFMVEFYISDDGHISEFDTKIGEYWVHNTLGAGRIRIFNTTLALPSITHQFWNSPNLNVADGEIDVYIGMRIDRRNSINERNVANGENNNSNRGWLFDYDNLTVSLPNSEVRGGGGSLDRILPWNWF